MKTEDILSKYQNYFLVIAIILSSLAVSIRFGDQKVNLILQDYPVLIFLMVVISSLLVVLYIQIDKRRITNLSFQIKDQAKNSDEHFDSLLDGLTTRQREIYNLIISGKTNKQIISELYIEQSTLKSHINQIYKKLNIKSRNDLKSKVNT